MIGLSAIVVLFPYIHHDVVSTVFGPCDRDFGIAVGVDAVSDSGRV